MRSTAVILALLCGSATAHAQATAIGVGAVQCIIVNERVDAGDDWTNTPFHTAMEMWAQGYVSGIDHSLQAARRPVADLTGRSDDLWRAMVRGCRAYPSALLQTVVEDWFLRVGGFKR